MKLRIICCLLVVLTFEEIQGQDKYNLNTQIVARSADQVEKSILLFSNEQWDLVAGNTKFSCRYLKQRVTLHVIIEIADSQTGDCVRGIGFRCSIFDADPLRPRPPRLVNHRNRFAYAELRRNSAETVELIFRDQIDWYSLQQNQ